MTTAKTYKSLEPEHALWVLNRVSAVLAAALLWRLVFWPGLNFWTELPTVLWFMLMGGMCSPAMQMLMLNSLANFGMLFTALTVMRLVATRLRLGFDAQKTARIEGRRPPVLAFPGPTVWQARLNVIDMQRRFVTRRKTQAKASAFTAT